MFQNFQTVWVLSHDLNVFGRMFLNMISPSEDQMPNIEICSHVSESQGEMKIRTFH